MALHLTSDSGDEIPSEQGRLLACLALATMRHLGGETMLLDEDNNPRSYRMARCGPLALLEKPTDAASAQTIDCYLVIETVPHSSGKGDMFRLDPKCGLFSLERLHNATPADWHLRARRDPQEWLRGVCGELFEELKQRVPQLDLDEPSGSAALH
jgi:hypothetical protein